MKRTKLEEWINGITMVADPCKMCAYIDKDKESHAQNIETCKACCWYHPSQFKERSESSTKAKVASRRTS